MQFSQKTSLRWCVASLLKLQPVERPPEPRGSASFYVFSMEHSGHAQFWQLLTRLMAAAERPLCAVPKGAGESAIHHLLRQRDSGFGIFYDVDLVPADIIDGDSRKLLFL